MRKLFISRGERSESRENTRVGVKNAPDSPLAFASSFACRSRKTFHGIPQMKSFLTGYLLAIDTYSKTLVTRTLKGNEKQFELAGNSSYRGKFQ